MRLILCVIWDLVLLKLCVFLWNLHPDGQAVFYLASLATLLAHHKLEAMSAQTVGKDTETGSELGFMILD